MGKVEEFFLHTFLLDSISSDEKELQNELRETQHTQLKWKLHKLCETLSHDKFQKRKITIGNIDFTLCTFSWHKTISCQKRLKNLLTQAHDFFWFL